MQQAGTSYLDRWTSHAVMQGRACSNNPSGLGERPDRCRCPHLERRRWHCFTHM